jgi:Fe-S-cluster-containing dehydrogenase component
MSISRRGFLGAAALSGAWAAGRAAAGAAAPQRGQPAPRTRWGMAIDVRKCLDQGDCDKCIVACHRAHNVPDWHDPAHEIKWIWKQRFEDVFPSEAYTANEFRGRAIPLLCNHCDNPPCVRVCPTQATWKREDGIVMMDWHRCIGCRYCVAACPYGSRSFNWGDPRPHLRNITADFPTRTKGVVEKCTFCEERLAVGEPPACVEACPAKAMLFGNLEDPASDIRRALGARFSVQRRPELGTHPEVFYIV